MKHWIVVFVGAYALLSAMYSATPANFFRAESGWFLMIAHSAPQARHEMVRRFFTTSKAGHYAPLALVAEFRLARAIGTRGWLWKARQLLMLAAVATVLALATWRSARFRNASAKRAAVAAAAVTSLLTLQPLMHELVAWPFLVMQLGWALCTVSALAALLAAAERRSTRAAWIAAVAACSSLQFFGLGVATAVATTVLLFALRHWRPAFALAAVGAFHALAMAALPSNETNIRHAGMPAGSLMIEALRFTAEFTLIVARSLIAPSSLNPALARLTAPAAIGVALVAAAVLVIGCAWRNVSFSPVPSVLRGFAALCSSALVLLIVFREWREQSPHGFTDFLAGGRYIVPATFAASGFVIDALIIIVLSRSLTGPCVAILVILISAISNIHFVRIVQPVLTPTATISHDGAWRSITTMARECIEARLPIPALPMDALTQEYHGWTLRDYTGLLRSDLRGDSRSLAMIEWRDIGAKDLNEYRARVPELPRLIRTLHLPQTEH